jgi:hypothetical protein
VSTPDERRVDDRIRAVFEEPVTPLYPLSGTWERIEREAARRTRARRLVTAGSVAAAVALLGAGAVWSGLVPDGSDSVSPATPGPTVATSPPGPTPSGTPATSPSATPSASASAAALPRGGPVPAGFVAVSASTTPEGYLYALGTAPCPAGPCTSLVRSPDGGATWVGVPAPRADLPDGAAGTGDLTGRPVGRVSEIRFATQRDGWAFGGGLWATHDGGATWREVRGLRGRVLDLVTDGDDVYAVTSNCLVAGCPAETEILHARASDGGFAPVDAGALPHVSVAKFSSGAGAIALTLGDWKGPQVLALRDGRWRRLPNPCPTAPNIGPLDVVPPASGSGLVAFCVVGGATGDAMAIAVRRSTDGGATWASIGEPLPVVAGWFSGTALTVNRLVMAIGGVDKGGSMHVSYQGGREWFDSTGPAPGEGWRWVAAAGGDRVLALPLVATGDLYVSTDGGASFAARPIR